MSVLEVKLQFDFEQGCLTFLTSARWKDILIIYPEFVYFRPEKSIIAHRLNIDAIFTYFFTPILLVLYLSLKKRSPVSCVGTQLTGLRW